MQAKIVMHRYHSQSLAEFVPELLQHTEKETSLLRGGKIPMPR